MIHEILNTKLAIAHSDEVEMQCDASKNAIGACLYSNGKLFQCYSKTLPESSRQWTNFERELYAIACTLFRFKNYLLLKKLQ